MKKCMWCGKILSNDEIIYDSSLDMEFCPHCDEGMLIDLNENGKIDFDEFMHAKNHMVLLLTIEEYRYIKPLLNKYYTEKDFDHIELFCRFKRPDERFLLCNISEKETLGVPIMFFNANFIDRIPFKSITF